MLDEEQQQQPRLPPANVEAEQALLAAILIKNSVFEAVADTVRPEHFSVAVHGRIYDAVGKLLARGTHADPVTLKNLFENDDALAEVGGASYLARLATSVVSIVNAPNYAKMIRDTYVRRQMIGAAERAINAAYDTAADLSGDQLIEDAEADLADIRGGADDSKVGPRPLIEFARDAVERLAEQKKRGGIGGVPTGFVDLDNVLGGFWPSDLIYVAGRPSMGKTALATGFMVNAALRGHPSYFCTMEMSGDQVAQRVLSAKTRIASHLFRTGQIENDDFVKLAEETARFSNLPLIVDETGGLSMALIRARARRFVRSARSLPGAGMDRGGNPLTPIIGVDYLQLMQADRRRNDNRTEDVSELSRGLKALAKELGVPLIVLSQLSRAVESRDNKRPLLSDLRESGGLEQDADVVMFVFREEYYAAREEPMQRGDEDITRFNQRYEDWRNRMERCENLAEVIVGKQRHGPIGNVKMRFDAPTTWFSDLQPGEYEHA